MFNFFCSELWKIKNKICFIYFTQENCKFLLYFMLNTCYEYYSTINIKFQRLFYLVLFVFFLFFFFAFIHCMLYELWSLRTHWIEFQRQINYIINKVFDCLLSLQLVYHHYHNKIHFLPKLSFCGWWSL